MRMKRLRFWRYLPIITGILLLLRVGPVLAAPAISADSYCLYEEKQGQVLWGKQIHQKRPPASTTKMMTAILVRGYCRLDEKVPISSRADRTTGTTLGLKTGQVWCTDDLLKAALMKSANDACVALAEHIAGSEPLFAFLMTKKAVVLGAYDTRFANSSGLPARQHYSSSYDLARIATALLHDPYLARVVGCPRARINHPGYPQGLDINNTNRLLTSYPGAIGIKTGTTNAAGNCLVAAARRRGRNLIAVVLHSNDRYADSRQLLDFGYNHTRLTRLFAAGETFKVVRVSGGQKYKMRVVTPRLVELFMAEGCDNHLTQSVTLDYQPRAPLRAGQKVGQLSVYYYGDLIETVPLVAGDTVKSLPRGVRRLWFYLLHRKETLP